MLFLFITTTIFFLLIIKIFTNKIINPLTIHLLFWTFWVSFLQLNLLNLYTVSINTYIFIYISILFFSIGYIVISGIHINQKSSNDISKANYNDKNEIKTNKTSFFIQIAILIILTYYLYRYTMVVSNLGIGESLRLVRFSTGALFTYGIERLFYDYVLSTIIKVILIINIVGFFLYNKKDKNLILSFINIGLYSFIGIGRLAIFDTMVYITIAYVFMSNNTKTKANKKQKKKKKFYITISFFIGLFIMIRLSAYKYRLAFNLQTIKDIFFDNLSHFVLYFTGPFVAFDLALNNNVLSNYQYTFGRATFAGFDEIIGIVLDKIGINYLSGTDIIGEITSNPIYIGNQQTFNAFYSGLLNFYLDGGVIGIIILSFIFGGVIGKFYISFKRNKNIFTGALLVYLVWMSITSIYRFPYTFSHLLVLFIFILASFNFRIKRMLLKLL